MDNLHARPHSTIYNIVGSRGDFVPPPGWLPYYRPVRPRHRWCRDLWHRRSMWRASIPGFMLIGLGLALFVATWGHWRRDRD